MLKKSDPWFEERRWLIVVWWRLLFIREVTQILNFKVWKDVGLKQKVDILTWASLARCTDIAFITELNLLFIIFHYPTQRAWPQINLTYLRHHLPRLLIRNISWAFKNEVKNDLLLTLFHQHDNECLAPCYLKFAAVYVLTLHFHCDVLYWLKGGKFQIVWRKASEIVLLS